MIFYWVFFFFLLGVLFSWLRIYYALVARHSLMRNYFISCKQITQSLYILLSTFSELNNKCRRAYQKMRFKPSTSHCNLRPVGCPCRGWLGLQSWSRGSWRSWWPRSAGRRSSAQSGSGQSELESGPERIRKTHLKRRKHSWTLWARLCEHPARTAGWLIRQEERGQVLQLLGHDPADLCF